MLGYPEHGQRRSELNPYKTLTDRLNLFEKGFKALPDQASSPFSAWDFIRNCPVYETLALQGLIPANSEYGQRLHQRGVVQNDSVICVFCKKGFTVRTRMNPLAQHLAQGHCGVAKCLELQGEYPVAKNPFSKDLSLADEPGIESLLDQASLVAESGEDDRSYFEFRSVSAAALEDESEEGFEFRSVSAASLTEPEEDDREFRRGAYAMPEDRRVSSTLRQVPGIQGDSELAAEIIKFFSFRGICNSETSRNFARSIEAAQLQPQDAGNLITLMKRLACNGEKGFNQRLLLKKVFAACENKPELVAVICAIAATVNDGCSDMSSDILDRMAVRCALANTCKLPAQQHILWTDFLTVCKQQHHESVFQHLFTTFRYRKWIGTKKKLLTDPEAVEIRGFYKRLLMIGCKFSSAMSPLNYPGYHCPEESVFYKFQDQFFEKILDVSDFIHFLESTVEDDENKVKQFIYQHDDAVAMKITMHESECDHRVNELEETGRKDMTGEIFNSEYKKLSKYREQGLYDILYPYIDERVKNNWDAICQNTVAGKIKSGYSQKKMIKLAQRSEFGDENILISVRETLSPKEVKQLERIPDVE